MSKDRKDTERSFGAYLAAIIANGVVLFLVNKAPDWNLPFLTDSYPATLWALNLSLLVQIGGNALLLFFHPRFMHYLAQAVFNAVSLLAAVVLAAVFPFDFTFLASFINIIVRIVLIAAAIGAGVGVIVNIFKAVGSLVKRREE